MAQSTQMNHNLTFEIQCDTVIIFKSIVTKHLIYWWNFSGRKNHENGVIQFRGLEGQKMQYTLKIYQCGSTEMPPYQPYQPFI